MKLVSFDAMRTLGIPGVHAVKPENWFREKALNDAGIKLGGLIFAYLSENTVSPSKPDYPRMPKAS